MTQTVQEQVLTILMNATYLPPKLFSDLRIKFGDPVAAPDQTEYDTTCEIDAIPGFGYFGKAILHYTRVPLSNLTNPNLYSLDQFTPQSLVDQINRVFNSFLTVADLQPFSIPEIPLSQSEVVQITAVDDSLTWTGSVNVTLTHDRPQLASMVYRTALGNPIHAVDQYGHETGRDKLWHVDFTSLRDVIKPVVYNPGTFYQLVSYADVGTLFTVMQKLGYATWVAPNRYSSLGDYPTSQISDSNPAFDRVVVQQLQYNPDGSPFVAGPIYLHYNILENR